MNEKLARELARKTYEQIDSELRPLSREVLFELIDSHSIKVGDSACAVLGSRGYEDLADSLVEAVLHGRFRHKFGRMRATSMLAQRGKSVPRAHEAYLHLLNDRSVDVVDNALFGLVFLQDASHLPAIEAARASLPPESALRPRLELAMRALREGNPFIFSPHYADSNNTWGLKDSPLKQLALAAEDEVQ